MKEITFRPLRRIKKTGKIAVASYTQWIRLQTANYSPFILVVIDNYSGLPLDEFVYNHEGEPLFFPTYDPNELPVFADADGVYSLRDHYANNVAFCTYSGGGLYGRPSTTYHGKGIDCCGTPTFTNLTLDEVATHYKDMNEFEPLTVGVVLNWLGWVLLRLENAKLTIRRL